MQHLKVLGLACKFRGAAMQLIQVAGRASDHQTEASASHQLAHLASGQRADFSVNFCPASLEASYNRKLVLF